MRLKKFHHCQVFCKMGCIFFSLALFGGVKAGVLKENGIAVKVIAKNPDVTIYDRPNGRGIDKMEQLSFAYVFANGGGAKVSEGHYKVGFGTEENDVAGYVKEEEVAEWHHRECVRFAPLAGRKHAFVYPDAVTVEKTFIAKQEDPQSALSQEPGDTSSVRYKMLLPVLESKSIKAHGSFMPTYEVAYLHEIGQTKSVDVLEMEKQQDVNEIIEASGKVNIMFVMDTTASMEPFIEGAKQVVNDFIDRLGANAEASTLSLGLIGYRDWYIDNSGVLRDEGVGGYVTKSFSDFTTNLRQFRRSIAQLTHSTEGSQESPEAVLDALMNAVEEVEYPPHGLRMIILIGDAPGHLAGTNKNPFGYSPEQILTNAKDKRLRISSFKITNPDNDTEVNRQHEQQFQILAGGLGSDSRGVFHEIQGSQIGDPMQRADFILKLKELIEKEQNLGSQVAQVSKNAAQTGQLPDMSTKPANISSDDYSVILTAISPDLIKAGAKSGRLFSTGWIPQQQYTGSGFQDVLEEYVMMTKDELSLLVFYLRSALQLAQASDANKVWKVMAGEIRSSTGEDLPDDQDWEVYISEKQGLPVREGLLKFSYNHVKQMSDNEKKVIIEKIERKIELLQKHHDDQSEWRKLSPNAKLEYTFVPVAHLP